MIKGQGTAKGEVQRRGHGLFREQDYAALPDAAKVAAILGLAGRPTILNKGFGMVASKVKTQGSRQDGVK
jgi:hypothetical protein